MRWTAKDSAVYFESKEYIDTALIPVISLSFEQKNTYSGDANEWIQRIASEIEKQFKGRVLLLPPFAYITSFQRDESIKWFRLWVEGLRESFKHIIFIGTDDLWNSVTDDSNCKYFQVPSIPLQHVDDQYKTTMVENEVKQLLPKIVKLWHGY